MQNKTRHWLRHSAACLPLAAAATQISPAQPPALHAVQNPGTWTTHHEHVLGTSLELRIRAASTAEADKAEAAALAELDRQDHLLSAWRADSEFSRWSATHFQPKPVSPDLFAVLAGFDHWRGQTGGALDPSAEAAARLWHQATSENRIPTSVEIAQTVQAIQQPHWQLDSTTHTATRLTDVPLALASFAKSYSASQAANAALRAGATGIMLNVGGDIVTRGDLRQVVEIADPRADAENDLPLDRIAIIDRAIATSGSYRRGLEARSAASLAAPQLSHILDPRTAQPTGHILSSTVIAPNAETAGALATAFSVLTPAESQQLAARTPGVDYLLITADGRELRSTGWAAYQLPGIRNVAWAPRPAAAVPSAGMWNPAYELNIGLELPRIDDARYRRPYVAVWIEDADHFPVRTLALWFKNPRWLPELKQWYRDDQVRNLSEGTDISKTISSATRPAGKYTLKWDGKDNEGKTVKAGKYSIVVETSREHGGYQVERSEMSFNGQPQQATLQPGKEMGPVTLAYGKR